MLNAMVPARVGGGQNAIKAAMTKIGASFREDRDGTIRIGVSLFIFRVELDIIFSFLFYKCVRQALTGRPFSAAMSILKIPIVLED